MAACPRHYAVARRRIKGSPEEIRVIPLTCKSWSCKPCAEKKSARYAKAFNNILGNSACWFYTLTFRHNTDSRSAWAGASKAWNRLNTNLHKIYGRFSYVRILESHNKSNYPHYHIVAATYFNPSIFAGLIKAAGFGWETSVIRVNGQGLSGYLRKYMTKCWPRADAAELRRLLRLRIVSVSRDLALVPHNTTGWCLVKGITVADHAQCDLSIVFCFANEQQTTGPGTSYETEIPFLETPQAPRNFIMRDKPFEVTVRHNPNHATMVQLCSAETSRAR